jgi:alkylation response protein AidB-like acyl-CoA dehydrogenase
MATDVQAARLLTCGQPTPPSARSTAAAAGGPLGPHRRGVRMAKLFASEVALRTTLESMRIFGGAGYSTELRSSATLPGRAAGDR